MIESLAILGGPKAVRENAEFRWPPIGQAEIDAVVRLMRAGELSYYGREGEVAKLEDGFCEYLGMPYGLAVSSGTAALHSAYFGLGLEPGDEVIVPTYTFLATVMPLFVLNVVPVLCDAETDTGNLDPAEIEKHIGPRTRAIVVTHLWGHPCDLPRISQIAKRHRLALVEDCSHAHGALCAGQHVGTFGDVSVFSLQAKKLVAAGQGGILVTRHREVYERAILLGHFKVRSFQEVADPAYRRYSGTGYGLNYRMHPLAAAIANVQLGDLERRIAGRIANLEPFSAMLAAIPGIHPPAKKAWADRHVYYSYKPTYETAELGGLPLDLYLEALVAEGVAVEKSETIPLHLEPVFQVSDHGMASHGRPERFFGGQRLIRYRKGDFPGSELYARVALALPPYTDPAGPLLEQYAEAFHKVAHHAGALMEVARDRKTRAGRDRLSKVSVGGPS